jgi:hypothetical protein
MWLGATHFMAKEPVVRGASTGVIAGYDIICDDGRRFGVFVDAARAHVGHRERIAEDNGRQTLCAIGAYGSFTPSKFAVEWSSMVGHVTIHSHENLSAIGVDGGVPAQSHHGAIVWFSGVAVKLPHRIGDTTLTPEFALAVDHIGQKAHWYRANGGNAVHYGRGGSTYFSGEAGIHCTTEKFARSGFTPHIFIGYGFDIVGPRDGRRPDRCAPDYVAPRMRRTRMNAIEIRIGANFGASPNVGLAISYDGQLAGHRKTHGFTIEFFSPF